MKDWITIRREHLQEEISSLELKLTQYQKMDISKWDKFNKENWEDTVVRIKNLIKEYKEQLEIINKAIKEK